ncbi:MAG: hypothetical protein HDR46_01235 [Bacteroides sp.]|nr:hypothetical protein [Bacteroides sp.]
MTGSELKDILTSLDESLANVARRLDVTPQNLDSTLKTKDVKTGLIERLSKLYNKPVSFFFDEQPPSIHTEGDYSPVSDRGDVSVIVGDAVLAERVKFLETILEEKERLIQVLLHK